MPTIATQANAVKATGLVAELQAMDAGILKDIPAKSSLMLSGKAMTQGQIDGQIKTYLSALLAATQAKLQYEAALTARKAMSVEARNFYLQLKKAVVVYFGAQSPQLADFGLKPAKARTPKTSAQKVVTAAKVKLTRQARGTTSKKQKLAINPGTATPAVTVGPDGKLTAIPPTVADGQLPGSTAPAGNAGTSSTPPTDAGSGTNGTSAPAAPAAGAPAPVKA